MSLACWSILSMSSRDPRNHVGCSRWPGPSSPRVMKIHIPSLSMPSAENSISSGVGSSYLHTLLFNVTCQPYHQASTPIPVHHIYSVLIPLLLLMMALRNRCRVRLSFCKCNKLLLSSSCWFCVSTASDAKERQHWVSRLQICTQHHTEAMGKVGWCGFIYLHEGKLTARLTLFTSFLWWILLKSVIFNFDGIRTSKIQIFMTDILRCMFVPHTGRTKANSGTKSCVTWICHMNIDSG